MDGLDLSWLSDPAIWVGLLTLIVLEIVLGIDNLVFIAILADKLPPHLRDRARLIGLSLALLCILIQVLLLSLLFLLRRTLRQNRLLAEAGRMDQATGLCSRKGFTAALDGWLHEGGVPVTLFFFSLEGYAQAVRLIGPDKEEEYLQSIRPRLRLKAPPRWEPYHSDPGLLCLPP